MAEKEPFLPGHTRLEDSVLIAYPAGGGFTPLTLFVCTYVAKLGNLNIKLDALTRLMCADPHGPLVAVNSNFGHACQPGYERLLKAPQPAAPRPPGARGRPRKVQGDGTCFNSAIEPILVLAPGASKVYKVKCFPTTGETQVPGVICPDLRDGHAALTTFVAYLNGLGTDLTGVPAAAAAVPAAAASEEGGAAAAGTAAAPAAAAVPPVVILSEQPKMLNYKYCLRRNSPRILINLAALARYMSALEESKIVAGVPFDTAAPRVAQCLAQMPNPVAPPFPVRETNPRIDDAKVSFRFRGLDGRDPRVNIFQAGKINILGAYSVESAQAIYGFFVELFDANWTSLVCLQPRRDAERRLLDAPPRPPPAPAPPPASPRMLTVAEFDEALAYILGGGAAEDSAAATTDSTAADDDSVGDIADADTDAILADIGEWE
jgi:hypothetical protein